MKTQKIVSIALFFTMLFTLFSFPAVNSYAAARLKTTDGYLFVEAEKIRGYDTAYLSLTDGQYFSGKKALQVIKSGQNPVPEASENEHINLSFKADKAGTYSVWCRSTANQKGSAGNSVYMSVDGGNYAYTKIAGLPEVPQWGKIATVSVSAAGSDADVRLRVRQVSEICIDCFVITSDSDYTPTDEELKIKSAPTPTPLPPYVTEKYITVENGFAIAEAEDLYYDAEEYNVTTYTGSSGKVLSVINEDKNTPDENERPHLDLSFKADKSGRYNIWVRLTCISQNNGANSVWFKSDDSTYAYKSLTGNPDTFEWCKLAVIGVEKADTIKKVYIRNRQAGRGAIRFDKVLITNNSIYIPEGANPTYDSNKKISFHLDETLYPKPTITPPPEHPRLMLRASDIETIKQNMTSEQNASAYNAFQARIKKSTDGILPEGNGINSNYTSAPLEMIEALAFDYVINKNEQHGREAIEAIKNFGSTVEYVNESDVSTYRYRTAFIFTVAEVYDWCYDLLSKQEKEDLIYAAELIAMGLDIGYPPVKQGAVSGHGGENSLLHGLLAFGIATYDERPDIYNCCAGRILSQYIQPRNFWYQSHSHIQGTGYGQWRGLCEIWSAWLFKRMAGVDIYTNQQYFPYERLYSIRPDGQAFRSGDDYFNASGTGTYWTGWVNIFALISNYYGDEFLKREFERNNLGFVYAENPAGGNGTMTYTPITHLLTNDPNLKGRSLTELPLTHYFPGPQGMMIARTGWNDGVDSPDVLVSMQINEFYGANHDHMDSGSFQIYYKGQLSGDSGRYDDGYNTHRSNYLISSVAHNTLAINDPSEQNGGAQRFPNSNTEAGTWEYWMDPAKGYEVGKVLAHEFGPDLQTPEYTYISGDITKAYSAKVKEVLRSMLFMPTGNSEHPAVMFVMDKIESSNPTYKKSFLLHMLEEPKIEGDKVIVERTQKDYNGRLVMQTLLPKADNVSYQAIGGEGKEFWINGTNWACKAPIVKTSDNEGQGWGRVEVSAKKEAATDYFLNVLSVSDAGGVVEDLDAKLIEGSNYAGAVIADRVAVFAKNKDRIENDLTFTIPGSGNYKVAVCGLAAGTWNVNGNEQAVVTEEGAIAYFDAPAGSVTLSYASSDSNKTFTQPEVTHDEYIGIRINNTYLYSDSPAVIVNDRTLVPMRAIFEKLGAEIEWDGETQTVTGKKAESDEEYTTVQLTIDDTTAYVNGEAKTLDSPATLINDRTMVPIRFIAESLGATVGWDGISQTVTIYVAPPKARSTYVMPEGYAKIKDAVSSYEGDAAYDCIYSYDGDYNTLWSSFGDHYAQYTLDKEYTIENVELYLNPQNGRSAKFEILCSTDGENFTSVYEGNSNGKIVNDWEVFKFSEPVKAKYIRYLAKGSDKNAWNGLKEIRFKYQ